MFDGLLFDLDGTLWDSVDAICISWNRALERLAPEYAGTVTRARLLPCMGMLLPDILHRLVPELDQERMKPILEEVLVEENAYVAAHGGVLYPGVEQTLAVLAARWPLFLVSNCQDGYIEAFFQAHGLGRYFTDYENLGRTGLPKADNIALVAERNGLRRPLYIGDTQGDYDAASKAGVPFLHAPTASGALTALCPRWLPLGTFPMRSAASLRRKGGNVGIAPYNVQMRACSSRRGGCPHPPGTHAPTLSRRTLPCHNTRKKSIAGAPLPSSATRTPARPP